MRYFVLAAAVLSLAWGTACTETLTVCVRRHQLVDTTQLAPDTLLIVTRDSLVTVGCDEG